MLQAQFPSPIGELHFSIKIFSFVSRSQRCFRPLSGSYISQLRLQVVSHGVTLVSVPYRGATFLNNRRTCSAKAVWKPFPSPIGELHFSIRLSDSLRNYCSGFRPLSGSYISQYSKAVASRTKALEKFPSPIGELHFSITPAWVANNLCAFSFRPLSGSYISQWYSTITDRENLLNSFRPLSGSYISQSCNLAERRSPLRVSVPYRGATFLNCFSSSSLAASSAVSVPYRGATFLNENSTFTMEFIGPVSVPYRGATFLNPCSQVKGFGTNRFPSPIGELHFSIPSPQPHVLSGTNRGIAGEK